MTSPLDADIRPQDPNELLQWAKLFGITVQELADAIDRAGPRAAKVARELQIVPDLPKRPSRSDPWLD